MFSQGLTFVNVNLFNLLRNSCVFCHSLISSGRAVNWVLALHLKLLWLFKLALNFLWVSSFATVWSNFQFQMENFLLLSKPHSEQIVLKRETKSGKLENLLLGASLQRDLLNAITQKKEQLVCRSKGGQLQKLTSTKCKHFPEFRPPRSQKVPPSEKLDPGVVFLVSVLSIFQLVFFVRVSFKTLYIKDQTALFP